MNWCGGTSISFMWPALRQARGDALLARRGITSTAEALGVALANHAVFAAPVGLAGAVGSAALAAGSATTIGAGAATLLGLTKIQVAVAGFVALAGTTTLLVQRHSTGALPKRSRLCVNRTLRPGARETNERTCTRARRIRGAACQVRRGLVPAPRGGGTAKQAQFDQRDRCEPAGSRCGALYRRVPRGGPGGLAPELEGWPNPAAQMKLLVRDDSGMPRDVNPLFTNPGDGWKLVVHPGVVEKYAAMLKSPGPTAARR